MTDPNPGDIVQIMWRDHYRYEGKRPPKVMQARSYGKVDEVIPEGIALIQNEVVTLVPGVEKIMDAQFIVRESITDIKILVKGGDKYA